MKYKRPGKNDTDDVRIDLENEEIDNNGDANGVVLTNMFRDVPIGVAYNTPQSYMSSSSTSHADTRFGAVGSEDRMEITDCLGVKE